MADNGRPWVADHPEIELLDRAVSAGIEPAAIVEHLGQTFRSGLTRMPNRDRDWLETQIAKRAQRNARLDELARLCALLGHDGDAVAAKRAGADRKLDDAQLAKMIRDTDAYARAQDIDTRPPRPRRTETPATDRQVAYILDLLAARTRTGEEGGAASVRHLYNGAGLPDETAVRKLTSGYASFVINSLSGN